MKRSLITATMFFALFLAGAVQAQGNVDCDKLGKMFNTSVKSKNGVCKVEIDRKSIKPTNMGKKLSPEMMELGFEMNFEQKDGQTAVIGELALLQEEVNPVLDELRKGKLEVTALHNHMMFEEPRIMYVHFQGLGDMEQQAKTIQAAIDKTSK